MGANDVILLESMLDQDRRRSAPSMDATQHHNFFVAKHYLRQHFSPGHDDLLSGIVDGAGDCGIDAIYLFANSMCVRDDTPIGILGRRTRLELVIMQTKNTAGFTESPVDKLLVNLPKLLTFGRDEEALAETANPRLIEVTRRFLETYRALELPELQITVVFAALRADSVHPNTARKAKELERCLSQLFSACEPRVLFLGSVEISNLARHATSITRKLFLAENPISTDMSGGYVAVVRLADYEKFITGRYGELDSLLFEANVRDYEGETAVNRSIQDTLEAPDPCEDFWWLNNGVTIVAEKVQPANKMLELKSPQIVNGLQTSTEIYKRRSSNYADDNRSVLVKVIEAQDNAARERIIRATNSQTAFGPSTLRATDQVQRQIEEYLGGKGLYYERRRRYYFNQGMPVDKIVSIDQMGQAVLSVLVQAPHIARSSPSTIFDQGIYEKVFTPDRQLPIYYACVKILRAAGDFLVVDGGIGIVEDYQYHLAMLLGMVLTGREQPEPQDVAALADADFSTGVAREMLRIIQNEYERANRSKRVLLLDKLAKDALVTEHVVQRGREFLSGGAGPVTPSQRRPNRRRQRSNGR
ncbi:AIPR family protein [Micromonospora chalcea]|uniref:AIPR family protein n=1 Tax=Micromonospora chalcea TaxID=1874 RepID=UPI001656C541|nr:AIPR family protein [Micromonospora chalcea]MBC8994026.1 AIPR family protein [Micromonospora chalcea]